MIVETLKSRSASLTNNLLHWRWIVLLSVVLLIGVVDISALHVFAAGGTTIYVSPTGDGASSGTQSDPTTLQHAQTLVRGMNQNMSGDITVLLAGGTYRLSQPLTLNQSDSGTNGHNVIYEAASGQTPVINGGVPVTGWKISNSGRNIWSAPAPAGLTNTRQLYINGVRAQRAQGVVPVKLTKTSSGYTASSSTMVGWRNPGDIEFVYTGGDSFWSEGSHGLGAWTEPRCPIASISGTTITMAQPCWNNSTRRVSYPSGTNGGRTINLVGPGSVNLPEYVENAFEVLDQPGEWYFDRVGKTIYYIPRSGENLATADVEAPVLQTLVSGTGTATNPIHNIEFVGLQFSYATWLTPSTGEGFSEIQANYTVTGTNGYAVQGLCQFVKNGTCPYGAWTQIPGNVSFTYDNHIQFLNGAFVHLGAAGLQLSDGSQSDTVQGNAFTDISGNGVEVGNVDIVTPTSGQATANNQILDNHLYQLPVEFHGGVAIDNGYTENDLISHNQIDHTAYSAISIGWGGWPDKIAKAPQSNPSHGNVLSDNLIFDQMQLLSDGGAIYTNGVTGTSLSNGEQITGNVIHDQFNPGKAIYTDNGATFVTIKNNVEINDNFADWSSRHTDYMSGASGDDPTDIEGNYWQQGDQDSTSKNVTVKGNHIITGLSQAPSSIVDAAGLESAYQSILNEQFGASSVPAPPAKVAAFAGNGFAYVAWNPTIFDGGSPVTGYTVTSSKGDTTTISASHFAQFAYAKLTGLTNGTGYTFTVTATNANGTSAASLPSGSVTPGTASVKAPPAPVSVKGEPGNMTASVHLNQPSSDGGSPIIAYIITGSNGSQLTLTGRWVLDLGTMHSHYGVVGGLTNGKTYTFKVVAVNVAGQSPAATSNAVTPG